MNTSLSWIKKYVPELDVTEGIEKMNTSLSWIKKYVPELDVTAQEYTDAMTLSGENEYFIIMD